MLNAEGMQLVYHHHMGAVVQTDAEIDASWQDTGAAMHLLLDTGHAIWGGDDPVALANTYAHQPCPLQGRAQP